MADVEAVSQEVWDDLGLPYGGTPMPGPVPYVVFHHTPGLDGGGDLATATAYVRGILRSHVYGNGWADIGYTWLVSGKYAFEGRGWGRTGAHAPGANDQSIGIAFLLDGRDRGPTAQEWITARWLIELGIRLGYLAPTYTPTGHRDWVSTDCPATLVYGAWTAGLAAAALPGTVGWVPTDELPAPIPDVQEDDMAARQMIDERGTVWLVNPPFKMALTSDPLRNAMVELGLIAGPVVPVHNWTLDQLVEVKAGTLMATVTPS